MEDLNIKVIIILKAIMKVIQIKFIFIVIIIIVMATI